MPVNNNPNEYDDARFLEITTIMMHDAAISRYVSELWMAGATEDDIKQEFEMLIDNLVADLAPSESKGDGGPKRAKPRQPKEEVTDEHTGQRSADR
jgi:hypothetical protein